MSGNTSPLTVLSSSPQAPPQLVNAGTTAFNPESQPRSQQSSSLSAVDTIPPSPSIHPGRVPSFRSSNARRNATSSASSASSASSSKPPLPSSSPPRKRRRRYTSLEKVIEVLKYIKKMRWTTKDFLSSLLRADQAPDHRLRRARGQFLDFAYNDFPTNERFTSIIGSKRKDTFLSQCGWEWVTDALQKELKAIAMHQTFSTFETPYNENERGSLDRLHSISDIVKELAPRYTQLLDDICYGRRPKDAIGVGRHLPGPTRVTILSLLCNASHPTKSSNFQVIIGLYLYHGGARRRVIDTLSSFGLTVSYTTIIRRLKDSNIMANNRVQVFREASSSIVTYDNSRTTEGRRGERVGDQREFRSITTFGGRSAAVDLLQDIWQPASAASTY